MKIAFDIGGVIGKYPSIFIPMMKSLAKRGIEACCVRARACNLVCETPALEGWPATG
jgi:hypothetical protein